ncbi:MAG: YHS domain-containing protein, partial [Candidatus Methylomirabilia bacterium]
SSVSVVTNSLRLRRFSPGPEPGAGGEVAKMAVDPVCKMDVNPAKAAGTSTYRGEPYYFCALSCKETFDKDPEQYVSK